MKTGRFSFKEVRYAKSLSCYPNRVPISVGSRSNSDREQEGKNLITFISGRSLPQLHSRALDLGQPA